VYAGGSHVHELSPSQSTTGCRVGMSGLDVSQEKKGAKQNDGR
jgi:hypothetical protein